jgi:putative NIF3 family GTP cyclohydrolase 1 type 2
MMPSEMDFDTITRRRFSLIAGATVVAANAQQRALTAEDIAGHIATALGGDLPANSADGFKAGNPATVITGVVTTASATADVLKRALATGANLVITYEPTFFGRADGTAPGGAAGRGGFGAGASDPVIAAKKEFIEKNGLTVLRLRDRWQSRKPDAMSTGLAESLEWARYRVKPEDALFDIPATTAEAVVAHIRARLNLKGGLRAVGDRKARARRVLLYPGHMPPPVMWARAAEADLIVTGEVREWENTFYAADLLTAGEKHGLVTIGRVVSEDPGMRACAAWLKTIVPQVPVQWIGAGDPYWREA